MPQMTVRLDDQPQIICPNCQSTRFVPTIELFYLSAFISPTKREHVQEHPGTIRYVCLKCQKVLPLAKDLDEKTSFLKKENVLIAQENARN